MKAYSNPRFHDAVLPEKILRALLAGAFLFCLLWGVVLVGYQMLHAGLIYQGISVSGIDLSGLDLAQARNLIAQKITYPQSSHITFRDGSNTWNVPPAQLGFIVDPDATALAAYTYGRSGDPFTRAFTLVKNWINGSNLSPVFLFDQRVAQQYLLELARQIDQPVEEATLAINGTDVFVKNGQIGRKLDIETTLALVNKSLNNMEDGIIPLVVVETPPELLDLTQQAQVARSILSAPLVLAIPNARTDDPGPWAYEPAEVAAMIQTIKETASGSTQVNVRLSADALRAILEELAPELELAEENTRFIFNDQTGQLEVIQPAIVGRKLDVEKSIYAINDKIVQGEHTVPLEFAYTEPVIQDNTTAVQLGITGLVSQQISYFYGSNESRLKNIELAAARFHGLLVAPGETFSMAKALGDVSLDNGYEEAMIIYGDQTIKGVGGGVCQVSTTLFRTAFFGGYPIVQRYAHAYRVSYYEQTETGQLNPDLAGLDATVFAPLVDFKFKNDTAYWILMETYFDGPHRTLTWKFYSSPDGRTVDWETSGPLFTVPAPKPVYKENPDLEEGEVNQVDWEAEGADIVVSRTVTRSGQTLYQDTFKTHYLPWQAVYEYGPGTEGMPPPDEEKE